MELLQIKLLITVNQNAASNHQRLTDTRSQLGGHLKHDLSCRGVDNPEYRCTSRKIDADAQRLVEYLVQNDERIFDSKGQADLAILERPTRLPVARTQPRGNAAGVYTPAAVPDLRSSRPPSDSGGDAGTTRCHRRRLWGVDVT